MKKESDFEKLKKLPPEERIRKLREIQERSKKAEEEAKKILEQSMAELKEDQLSEEEERENMEALREKIRKQQKKFEEESLEERLRSETPEHTEDTGPQYDLKERINDVYRSNNDETISNLYSLMYKEEWDEEDVNNYNQIKQGVQTGKEYISSLSDQAAEKVSAGDKILSQLGYKRKELFDWYQ